MQASTRRCCRGVEVLFVLLSDTVQIERVEHAETDEADPRKTLYDLATRRGLILIGEDLANAAFDAPCSPPKSRSRWPIYSAAASTMA